LGNLGFFDFNGLLKLHFFGEKHYPLTG